MTPLVSCLMPTCNRRRFVPRAVADFLRQDYTNAELVVVDDGADAVADLLPADPRIRYVHLPSRYSIGAKRNEAARLARGDLLLHWDDDDWMAPTRVRRQVEILCAAGAEVCGMRRMLFHDESAGQTWLYEFHDSDQFWAIGGSLLFTRAYWERAPFPDMDVGEDTRFLWSHPRTAGVHIDDLSLYIARIHDRNTSPKERRGAYWSLWPGDIRQLLGNDHAQPGAPEACCCTREMGGDLMKLNLGCCDAPLPGFVNVDKVPGPGVEVVADLSQPWPWADDAATAVRAHDIIEHLPDKIHTMNELWRVLGAGGQAEIAVPTTDGSGAWQDPTHVSFWNRRSFLYYEAGNPYRERFARHYGIRAKFRVMFERVEMTMDGPRLYITLEAVKP